MNALYREIHRWHGVPFEWGVCDCALVLADWIAVVHGSDPAESVRYTYESAMGAQRRVGWLTDPVRAIGRLVEPMGLALVDAPEPGDIAVIEMHDGARVTPHGALWTGHSWAVKSEGRGATTIRPSAVNVLAIWGVGYDGA